MSTNESDPILISQLIHEASFPIYGLVDHPWRLAVRSVSWGSFNTERTSVGLTFGSQKEQNIVEVISTKANIEGIVYPSKDIPPHLFADLDSALFAQYQFSDEARSQAGPPQILEETWTIAGVPFRGEVRHWPSPYHLSRFAFSSQASRLSGSAFGISLQELLHTFQYLVVVNQREDLLAQYQREFEHETERLLGREGAP